MSTAQTSSGGISLLSLIGVVFIILKLCGVIAWSWVWVLAPFWIPTAIVLAILGIFAIILAFAVILKAL